jgi:hypothetical protein
MNVGQSHLLEEKKTVVFYFYDEGQVSLHFKALSGLSILKDDFVFMSCSNPSQQLMESLQIRSLPGVAGLIEPLED